MEEERVGGITNTRDFFLKKPYTYLLMLTLPKIYTHMKSLHEIILL